MSSKSKDISLPHGLNKKKSVLIVTGIFYPDIGGPASYAMHLAKKLISDGYDVGLITYSDSLKNEKDDLNVIRVWRKIPKGLRHLWFLISLFRVASKYDIIYSLNAVSVGLPARIVARFFKKDLIVRIAGDAAWERAADSGKTSLLINDFQNQKKIGQIESIHRNQVKTCKEAKLIIVPSKFLASIVKGWGIDESKIKVIYNGVESMDSDLTKEEARKNIGIAGNILLSYGRLTPWKGFRMLIKIMPKLLEINQFFRLVIVGDGPEMAKLKSIVSNMGLDRKVYLVGKKDRDQMKEYLKAADIFILNTGYEGFSHQVLEVMSAGVPVITTPSGGNVEVMKQGENGFMVKYNDEFNLIEAVRTTWASQELKDEFINNGRETFNNFSFEKMYQETIKTLNL